MTSLMKKKFSFSVTVAQVSCINVNDYNGDDEDHDDEWLNEMKIEWKMNMHEKLRVTE